MNLSQISSPILKNYLLSRFPDLNLTEKKATFHNCPKYPMDLKCCTFHPFLTNYSVGAILSDPNTPKFILEQIRSKIQNQEYALPLGLFAPVKYQIEFHQRNENDFGFNSKFLCPYFDKIKQQCGIWAYRGSVCTSYFCDSDFGKKGLQFWSLFGDYLHYLEMSLAQDCMVSLGLDADLIDLQLEYINCESASEEEVQSNSMSDSIFNCHWKSWMELNQINSDNAKSAWIEKFYIDSFNYAKSISLDNLKIIFTDDEIDNFEIQLMKNHKKFHYN